MLLGFTQMLATTNRLEIRSLFRKWQRYCNARAVRHQVLSSGFFTFTYRFCLCFSFNFLIIIKITSLQEKVGKLLESSLAFKEDAVGMTKLWNRVKDRMYSLDTRQLQMGLGDQVRTSQMSLNVAYVLHNILANKRPCVIDLVYYSKLYMRMCVWYVIGHHHVFLRQLHHQRRGAGTGVHELEGLFIFGSHLNF